MPTSHILDKPYTENQLSGFKDLFTKMKTYKDGTIHSSEYFNYLNHIGVPTTPAQAQVYKTLFQAQRGDDFIELNDVMGFLRNLHNPAKLMLEIVEHFDKDKNGFISQDEFQLGMTMLASFDPAIYGDKAKISFAKLLQEADTNKDGKLKLEELATWLSQITTSHILSEPYSLEELSHLREVFKSMKTYKDGNIHGSEYADFCNAVGIPTTPEQGLGYQKFWKSIRGDDLIPLEGTIGIFSSLHDPMLYAIQISKLFDKDNDGVITKEEFEAGMRCMVTFDPERYGEKGSMSFEQFVAEADTNQDGIIQMEELANWLGQQQPSRVSNRAFTPEELEKFRTIFRNMKTYEDGTIHCSEQRLFQNLCGVPTTQAQVEVYNHFYHELRGDDRIPMEELIKMFSCLHCPKDCVLELCHQFDMNKNGVISKSEFEMGIKFLVAFDPEVFGEKGTISFEQILHEADTNKDGQLQISELANWLSQITTSHILSKPYSTEELSYLRDVFKSMKTFENGNIHGSEYVDFCNAVGIPTTPEQGLGYQKFWNSIRGDDLIPLEGTIDIFSSLHDPFIYSLQMAKLFDKDNDRIIYEEEFEACMKCMITFDSKIFGEKGNMSFEQFVAEADTNQDGIIQMEELAIWLGQQQPSRMRNRGFTPEELEKFTEIFRNMKTYKDGTIHCTEQRLFQNLCGVSTTQDQVEVYNRFFHELRGDDRIPMKELLRIFGCLHNPTGCILELCHQFDRNKNGVISKGEFEIGIKFLVAFDPEVFGEKGKISFEQMLQEADTDKDGQLQIAELEAWLSIGSGNL